MKRKLVFVGPMHYGQLAMGGDTMKNQLFLQRFNEVYDEVIIVDTFDWKRKPLVLMRLIITLLRYRDLPIVLSVNPHSADILIRFIHILKLDSNTVYWVVGGSFHTMIKEGRFNINHYKKLKAILVQGQSMVDSLCECGLTNAIYIPNSKVINCVVSKSKKNDEITHFVFLSRIEESKGCKYIFESIDRLNSSGFKGRFDVSFYGMMSKDKMFSEYFENAIAEHNETRYGGLLNLRDDKNYDLLGQYDVMLFPTFWYGEGFPGVIIDAYIASLPIIATDWNLNKDVVRDGETGWIIPIKDTDALAERMIYAIEHPNLLSKMSENSGKLAFQYDSRKVLSEEKLRQIGILS